MSKPTQNDEDNPESADKGHSEQKYDDISSSEGQSVDAPIIELINASVGIVMTVLKAYLLVFLAILLRWTTPRVRIDQLLDLGWKFLLPISLVNLLITAGLKLAFPVAFGG